ncbi:MAG: RNA-directed DNA polymerase [Acidobacteria bacterium]|nr:RNA-directed DNA polymerase [Acidobacteriota bacterium]
MPPRAATLSELLKKGYFPRELPPPFQTASFAAYAPAHAGTWGKAKWTRCVRHNLARPGGLRRPLGIPNPISYYRLAELIVSNWASIRALTWTHRLSASRPYVMMTSPRAVVPRYRYAELPRLRALRRRAARYLVRTDISQFYPTLYTHAIPWALHGKQQAKAALAAKNKGSHLLGNKIDKALSNMNDGQTHGVPIGPDTSLVVAEIVLAAADNLLETRCKGLVRGFRYVDDYELSFATLRDAEQVLADIQGVLSEYELALNPRKTGVQELPQALDGRWASDLSRFKIRDSGHSIAQRNDLVGLFSLAFEAAAAAPEDSVLRYAVARVQSLDVSARAWRTFQNCLLGAASADSSTLPTVLGTLYKVSAATGDAVSKAPLAEVCESVVLRHAPRGQGSEVAWALWAACAWKLALSVDAIKAVGAMDDDVVSLLALYAESQGLFAAGGIDKTRWSALASDVRALESEHWLLAYEANRQGWLPAPAVAAEPEFAAMHAAGVSFFDGAACTPQYPAAALALPGGQLPDYYA